MNLKEAVRTVKKECGITDTDIQNMIDWIKAHPVSKEFQHLVPVPKTVYVGKDLRDVVLSILSGTHVILEGAKGAGKNTLIDTVAYLFSRPIVSFPFNSDVDVSMIVGTDTLSVNADGKQVISFRKHQLVQAMESGAWFVADEINMTRADVLSVLHMVTDDRAILDYPGVGLIKCNPGFRFLGTMNYGYMGTSELNEAFADRFNIIHLDPIGTLSLSLLLQDKGCNKKVADLMAKLYFDLEKKAERGEISSRAVSIRGLLNVVKLARNGMDLSDALTISVVNKAFDSFEKTQIKDVISTLFPRELEQAVVDISDVPERSKS